MSEIIGYGYVKLRTLISDEIQRRSRITFWGLRSVHILSCSYNLLFKQAITDHLILKVLHLGLKTAQYPIGNAYCNFRRFLGLNIFVTVSKIRDNKLVKNQNDFKTGIGIGRPIDI